MVEEEREVKMEHIERKVIKDRKRGEENEVKGERMREEMEKMERCRKRLRKREI